MRGKPKVSPMPLSRATARNLLHLRDIQLRGYERADGLLDIEAHLTDSKPFSWSNHDRGAVAAGEPMHDMWLRITVDRDMNIIDCEAAMDGTPHTVCPGVAPNYRRLVGLNIGKGFLKAAMQQLGGVQGCTHLRELLQQVGTVAWQSMFSTRMAKTEADAEAPRIPPALLNTCYAYDETGAMAARYRALAKG
jgi:hypothetical protein